MSQWQVEALVGKSAETCWEYDRGNGLSEMACFRDGMASAYSRTERKPGSNQAHIDVWFAGEWPPRKPAQASSKTVELGMPSDRVARLLGKPSAVREQYNVANGYRGFFVDGKLVSFDPIPMPVVP
jgi:hypothetical protein